MKKLIVPVDFSANSLNALRFALDVAVKNKLEVVVIHQLSLLEITSDTTFTGFYIPVATDQIGFAEKELERFVKKALLPFKGKGAEKLIHSEVVPGAGAADIILQMTQKHKADMVIMGTTGASGLKRIFIGSVAARIVEKSKVPVLVVPRTYRRKPLTKIGYASDLAHAEKELAVLQPIAALLGVEIEMFHVEPTFPTSKYFLAFKADKQVTEIKSRLKLKSLDYQLVKTKFDNDFYGGVHKYVRRSKPGILAMFSHKRSWIGSLIEPSRSKGLAYHTEVPVISIKS
jgi:nucleotide-binding universal stress UspA family protein